MKDVYHIDDFYSFFEDLRKMVELYLFKGHNRSLTVKDYLFGYSDDSISHMSDELDYFDGRATNLDHKVSPIFND